MEGKEGGQVTYEKTKSPEDREAQLWNAVTERGVRLTAGGEFLDTTNPQNAQQQAELTQKVSDIVDGKEPVDPKIAQAIGLYSDQDRANHWGNTPFEEAKRQARDDFTQWAIYTKTLENTDRQNVYEDTVAVLGQLEVTIENFATLSQEDRNTQFSHLYTTYYAQGTDVEAIGNAFLQTARNTDNTVDVLLLQRRLASLDPFLITCGTEAKAAVREYVLKQGFINGDKQAKDIFKQAASTVVHPTQPEKRDPVLKQIYDFCKKIDEEKQEQMHQPKPTQVVPANEEEQDTPIIKSQPLPMISTSVIDQNRPAIPEEHPSTMPEDRIVHIPSPAEQTEEEARSASGDSVIPQEVTLIPNEPSELKQRENISSLPFPKKTKETENSIIGMVGFAEKIHSPTREELAGDLAISEDNNINDPDHGVFAVFDGVGGYDAGEYASELAATSIGVSELATLPDTTPVETVEQVMREVILNAHLKIYSQESRRMGRIKELKKYRGNKDKSEEEIKDMLLPSEFAYMATTATVVKLLHDGTVVIGSVGDSRAYVLRENKPVEALEELTLDDIDPKNPELNQQYFALHKKLSNAEKEEDLEIMEQYFFKKRNELGEALGFNGIDSSGSRGDQPMDLHITIKETKLEPGDVLLLTTDGIHDNLTDDEIEAILRKHPNDPQGAADDIQKKAYERSQDKTHYRHKEDDMSVLVIPRKV